jgi:hypothetical protein
MAVRNKQDAAEVIEVPPTEAVVSMDAVLSRDRASSAYFELPARHRWMFAAAAVGAWGPVSWG